MKDFKKKIKDEGQQYFKSKTPNIDFSNKLEFSSNTSGVLKTKFKKWKPFVFASGSLMASLVASVAIGAIVLSGRAPLMENGDFGLAQVRDVDELRDLIDTSYYRDTPETGWYEDNTASSAMALPDGESQAEDHSETNVQVEGVDEGDIIKTDGDRIYKINYNRLQVVDVLQNGAMELVLDNTMATENESNSYTYFSDLYLSDDFLIVIGQRYTYFTYETFNGESDIYLDYMYWYGIPQTVVLLYDLDDLSLDHEFEINGSIISSRRIDNRLYVISNHYPVLVTEDDDPRPVFKVDDEVVVPAISDIKYNQGMPTESFTIISTIFLSEEPTLEFDIFLGVSSWGIIYVSPNAIYLASYYYVFNQLTQTYGSYGLMMSYLFEADGTVTYGGSAYYQGYVLNQFAIDEYDGYLRIVTTFGWGTNAINRLYVFKRETIDDKRTLTSVSVLEEGLGKPGETVRSVRFNGEMATVVTYEQTDPLYVIDLSDPTAPTIRAGLEVTGYATYQHIWDTNLIIGIGYEAEGNQISGLKLTMFDISNPDDPLVVGTPLIMSFEEYGWTYSEALYNHKALLISKTFNFIGFGVSTYHWTADEYWYSNDYYVFDINPESLTPITISKIISHSQFLDPVPEDPDRDYYWYYPYVNIDRAVTVGNYLFAMSNLAITSHAINDDYAQVASIDLMITQEPVYIL